MLDDEQCSSEPVSISVCWDDDEPHESNSECPQCGRKMQEVFHAHNWGPLRVYSDPTAPYSKFDEINLLDVLRMDSIGRIYGDRGGYWYGWEDGLISFDFGCRHCQLVVESNWDDDKWWPNCTTLRDKLLILFDADETQAQMNHDTCFHCRKPITDNSNRTWYEGSYKTSEAKYYHKGCAKHHDR